MKHTLKKLSFIAVVLSCLLPARAFTPVGPLDTWMTIALGYNGADLGPMNYGDEYRIASPTLTYAIDQSFLNYFGVEGERAVDAAFAAQAA